VEGSILVVEHDALTRDIVARNFRSVGYDVFCARDFSEAEALVSANRPAVALFEWLLGAPGVVFARQLRRDRRTADTSIVIVGRADAQAAVAALESGADDYVPKPFAMPELIARVRAVLRRRAPQLADDVIERFGLRFNLAARRVTAGKRDIEMSSTEFNLLHFLTTHPHRTFSRSQLLDEVWGDRALLEERTVDVHICRLRRALWPTPDVCIETVVGVGYRLQAVGRRSRRPGMAVHDARIIRPTAQARQGGLDESPGASRGTARAAVAKAQITPKKRAAPTQVNTLRSPGKSPCVA
jgi:two-component system phosphate regulon response regulator PhoB